MQTELERERDWERDRDWDKWCLRYYCYPFTLQWDWDWDRDRELNQWVPFKLCLDKPLVSVSQ